MSRGSRQLFISSQEYVPIYFTFIKWTDLIIFTIISEASIRWNLVKYRGSPTPNSKTYWRQTLDTFRDLPLIHKNIPPLHLKHVRWHCKQGLMSVERRKVEQHVIVGSLQPIIVGKHKVLSGFSEKLHFLSVLTGLPWTNTFTSEKTLCKYV